MKAGLLGIFAGLLFTGAAFAGIDCTFYNIPNGSYPNKGQVRNDFFKFPGLGNAEGMEIGAYWTPFLDLNSEAQALKVTRVDSIEPIICRNCYDIYAKTLGNGQVIEFKISLRSYGPYIAILGNIDYRLNSEGASKWLPFNETPGACFVK